MTGIPLLVRQACGMNLPHWRRFLRLLVSHLQRWQLRAGWSGASWHTAGPQAGTPAMRASWNRGIGQGGPSASGAIADHRRAGRHPLDPRPQPTCQEDGDRRAYALGLESSPRPSPQAVTRYSKPVTETLLNAPSDKVIAGQGESERNTEPPCLLLPS